MKRTDIINFFIKKFNYTSYLEIGVQDPTVNFDKINIEHKISVDPFPVGKTTYVGTSDEFFSRLESNINFDIVFIDGLHHSEQVMRDIQNSINHLSAKGTIICHDCLPTTELMQLREDNGAEWTGDVWKTIAELRVNSNNLEIFVINTDYGCAVIRNGSNIPYKPKSSNYLSYEYYNSYKEEMLNVISVNEFIEYINN